MLAVLRQRNFGLLWFASLISLAGDWMLSVALPLYVYELTGSTLATSAMLIVRLLPNLLLGSVAGVFVDRWDRQRTMVVSNLLLALSILPILFVRSADMLWVVYLAAFIEATVGQFFRPAKNATLPNLVAEKDLVVANALNALNNNLARLVGPALGGVLTIWLGLHGIALLDAMTYLLAAALIALIHLPARPRPVTEPSARADTAWTRAWREWLAGLALVPRQRVLTIIFIIIAITSVGEGIMGALFVIFISDVLGGGVLERGWLMSAQAVGGLLGGMVVSHVAQRLSLRDMIGWGAIAFGLIDLAIFNYPTVIPGVTLGIALMVLVGIPGALAISALETLLQTSTQDAYRGRILGALGTTQSLSMLLGAVVAGALGDKLGTVTLLNVQGFGFVVAGCVALATLGSAIARQPSEVSQPVPEGV